MSRSRLARTSSQQISRPAASGVIPSACRPTRLLVRGVSFCQCRPVPGSPRSCRGTLGHSMLAWRGPELSSTLPPRTARRARGRGSGGTPTPPGFEASVGQYGRQYWYLLVVRCVRPLAAVAGPSRPGPAHVPCRPLEAAHCPAIEPPQAVSLRIFPEPRPHSSCDFSNFSHSLTVVRRIGAVEFSFLFLAE